jgi:hypothetical protein
VAVNHTNKDSKTQQERSKTVEPEGRDHGNISPNKRQVMDLPSVELPATNTLGSRHTTLKTLGNRRSSSYTFPVGLAEDPTAATATNNHNNHNNSTNNADVNRFTRV